MLWAAAGLYSIALIIFGGFSSWRDYRDSLDEAERNATNYVSLLDEHARRSFEATDVILDRMVDRIALRGLAGVISSAEEWHSLEAAAAASPQTGALYLVDASARLKFTTRQFPLHLDISFASYDFYTAIRDGHTRTYLSRSFFEPGTNRPCFAMARRIDGPDGRFVGIAVATIETEYFRDFYKNLGFSDHVAFGIYKHDGSILVRYPMADADIGRVIPANAPLLQLVPTKPIGTFRAVSTYDSFNRIVSYRHVDTPPIILWVATTEDDALAGWRQRLVRNAVLAVISLVVLTGLSWLATRGLRREEQTALKLEALFQMAPVGMVRTTVEGRFLEANPTFLNMVGLSSDELLNLGRVDLTPEGYANADRDQMAALVHSGRFGPYEKEYLHKDGSRLPVSLNGALVDDGSAPPYVWSIVEDISARRQAEASMQMAASVFQSTAEGILVTDADGVIISVNPAYTAISGYQEDDLIGRKPSILKSGRHSRAFYQEMWTQLLGKGIWQGQIWNRRKDGDYYLAWQTISRIADARGQTIRFVSVSSDMTELHRKDEQIRHLAYHDSLTGLPNRLLLQDRLGQAIEVARREDAEVAVMFLDLDRFKLVNDSLGHYAGDDLLGEIGRRLQERLHKGDTIARLGGDEFVVVMSFIESLGQVAETAEAIIERIAEPILLGEHEMRVTASIGIAVFPRDGSDVGVLMRNADTAMYGAKDAGRNAFRFFDPAMTNEALQRLEMEAAIGRALENREFVLHYQPKIDLRSGAMAGVEALVRWNRPGRGLVLPAQFIPLTEETGQILALGDWVLDEALSQFADWKRRNLPVGRLSINVSPRQVLTDGFAARIASALARCGVAPSQVEIELTEGAIMSDPERAIGHLTRLRQQGVGIAVDDFGTAYSSLNYLKRLPLTAVKVDRSFIAGLDLASENAAIVGAILGLAEALRLDVIAEGIETEGEARYLTAAGCPLAQGHLYAPALPADRLEEWIGTRQRAPSR